MSQSRRNFLNQLGLTAAGLSVAPFLPTESFASLSPAESAAKKFSFDISLAEFSFAPELMSGKMKNMEFPARAKNEFGINVLEYVSGFFNNKHTDQAYLNELKQRCDDLGMKNNLIMVDGANITDLDAAKRQKAVESHYAWVDAAKFLGCSSIRVNLGDAMKALSGPGEEEPVEAVTASAADGYAKLLDYAAKAGMNVIVENHFGISTDPDWLVRIMKLVNRPNAGLLPDFGNFCAQRSKPETLDIKGYMNTKCLKEHDKYEGVRKMLPYAKGISAKTHKFDASGNEVETDFRKMFTIIKDGGFKGYVGIEYEGGFMNQYNPTAGYLPSAEGVKATKVLLEKVRTELA